MSLPTFGEIKSFSNLQIFTAIKESETELIKLRLKKVSGQPFKSHEIKIRKRYLAQLKTLLSLRLNRLDKDRLMILQNYLTIKINN